MSTYSSHGARYTSPCGISQTRCASSLLLCVERARYTSRSDVLWQVVFGLVVDFDGNVVLVVVGLTLEVEVVVDGGVDGEVTLIAGAEGYRVGSTNIYHHPGTQGNFVCSKGG